MRNSDTEFAVGKGCGVFQSFEIGGSAILAGVAQSEVLRCEY
jgi:hypothetical protein